MTWDAFLDTSPREFYNALSDKNKYDGISVETTIKSICNVLRSQTMHLMNIQLGQKHQIRNPRRLMQFPWDEETKPQSKESMIATMKTIVAMYKDNKKKK